MATTGKGEGFWAEHVAALRASGQTSVAYANDHGLSVHALGWWRRKLNASVPAGAARVAPFGGALTRHGDYSYGLYLYAFPAQQALVAAFGTPGGALGNFAMAAIIAGGFAEGDTFEYMFDSTSASEQTIGELFQANVAQMGFNLELTAVDIATLNSVAFGDAAPDERPHFVGSWGWWPDYNDPYNQLEEQMRLTIEGIKERQEWEIVNNKKFGLIHSVDPAMRISTRYGAPTPDDLDELLALVWKKPAFFLAHPKAIAAFERECTWRGVPPVTANLQDGPASGRAVILIALPACGHQPTHVLL